MEGWGGGGGGGGGEGGRERKRERESLPIEYWTHSTVRKVHYIGGVWTGHMV